jgi:hypothetical protein
MNKRLPSLLAAGLLIGCTPTNFVQPNFNAVPPETAAKPRPTKPDRSPVSAKEVTNQNARQMLKELGAELDEEITGDE